MEYIPLVIKDDNLKKVTLLGALHTAECVLLVGSKLESKVDVENYLKNAHILIKLTPFKSSFRAKMLASLKPEEVETAVLVGAECSLNLFTRESAVHNISKRRMEVNSEAEEEGEEIILSDSEKAAVQKSIEDFTKKIAPIVGEMFISFVPEASPWREKSFSHLSKERLTPFQGAFPEALEIRRGVDDSMYILDDLYCTKPACPCTDVTCVVLKFDGEGPETAYAGFTYDIESKKFKLLPNFPNKLNAKEWFKKFDAEFPLGLEATLASRFHFMRKEFMAVRK